MKMLRVALGVFLMCAGTEAIVVAPARSGPRSPLRKMAAELLQAGDRRAPISTDQHAGAVHQNGDEGSYEEDEMAKKKPPPKFEDFLPQCLLHSKKLIHAIDRSYTDVQIVPTLDSICLLEHYFPHAREDGFDERTACHEFAEELAAARDEELNTGDRRAFNNFCHNFYGHKYGGQQEDKELEITVTEAPKPEKPKEKGLSGMNWILIILVIIAVIIGGFIFCRKA
jgi:hypothetical protein